ncbi:hypothetical protein D3C73_1096810 [compost metagenome]
MTLNRPSASTWKVTRIWAPPAGRGGKPRSEKRASERQSCTNSRSPCSTWIIIALWPSLKVVNSCARATGMVVLRGITFSTRPPMVSRPSESGITSSSSMSLSGLLPTKMSAWIAAPIATTLSGSIEVNGVRPKNVPTCSRTRGTRVEPPTMTTSSTSSALTPASFSARRQAIRVRFTRVAISASNCARVTSPCQPAISTTVLSASLSATLAAMAASSSWRCTP